ncbi:methyl-accepting chemotaxis protein [Paenibacillus puldeungensis]|uniref:Methyl-accepting chemotaxis protein n=1 Tax=Paenibacillus puldeungensis TaxID=696536 RepID=A0ABW3RXH7_9BACL
MENEAVAVLERPDMDAGQMISPRPYCRNVPVIGLGELCRNVLQLFRKQEDISCIVCCDEAEQPLGLLMRDRFYRHLTGRFAADLFYDRPALLFADKLPLICELTMPAEDLLDAALGREDDRFYDCMIMTERGKFYGVLTVQDLMQISRDLQRVTNESRRITVRESHDRVVEIKQSVKRVSTTAERSLRESEIMSGLAKAGRLELEEVKASFTRVLEMTRSQEKQVAELLERAEQISSIAAHIQALAEQSGMLAINASIEAAHAGEHGRGFAVVASEVKKLSEQTKRLSEDIGKSLATVNHLVEQTADTATSTAVEMEESHIRVGKADQTFEELVQSARAVETRGREMYQFSDTAASRTDFVLRELEQLALPE